MKYILICFLLMPATLLAQKFKINVFLKGMPNGQKYYLMNESDKIDSAVGKGQLLSFYVNKNGPQLSFFGLDRADGKQSFLLLLENRSCTYRGDFNSDQTLSADHSQVQNDMKAYVELTNEIEGSIASIKDTSGKKELLDSLKKDLRSKNVAFIKAHPSSMMSAKAIFIALGRKNIDKKEAYEWYSLLSRSQQGSEYGKAVVKSMRLLGFPKTGEIAPNFVMNDINGKKVDLKDYRGKNVVLIFGGSSCGPCRWEAPQVVELYERCKTKNVAFISVSIDENKESWLSSVRTDKCTWTSVSDLKGWASEAALSYGINAIPQHVIINTEGVIVDLPGPIWELKDKLMAFLDKQ